MVSRLVLTSVVMALMVAALAPVILVAMVAPDINTHAYSHARASHEPPWSVIRARGRGDAEKLVVHHVFARPAHGSRRGQDDISAAASAQSEQHGKQGAEEQ